MDILRRRLKAIIRTYTRGLLSDIFTVSDALLDPHSSNRTAIHHKVHRRRSTTGINRGLRRHNTVDTA